MDCQYLIFGILDFNLDLNPPTLFKNPPTNPPTKFDDL
tara:strand:+ start:680 stop:793 length:114 start_codon:yes stop_codon:yes gene_type:complete